MDLTATCVCMDGSMDTCQCHTLDEVVFLRVLTWHIYQLANSLTHVFLLAAETAPRPAPPIRCRHSSPICSPRSLKTTPMLTL